MNEVRYSVNGKYFKDFGTYISSSEGLFDALKRKPVNTYDWAEYHGSSPDLDNPRFEQREITLKGFVTGSNWEVMKSNFDAIVSEFQKAGTQRLLIEPFGLKPLPYEVCMIDEVRLQKEFKNGKMVGTFTLKLIEPNPIKIVYTTDADLIDLSFLSKYESEVFWGDGTKNIFRGNITQTKDFNFPSYQASGYSLAAQSVENPAYYTASPIAGNSTYEFSVEVNDTVGAVLYVIGRNDVTGVYEAVAQSSLYGGTQTKLKAFAEIDLSKYGKFIFKVLLNGEEIPGLVMTNPRIEKVKVHGEWIDMTGKTKYIIIAGNTESISDIETNATELWTRL